MNEQCLKVQGLKVAHINVNGLLNKIHEIQILLHSVKLDILVISKTHLHVDIKNEQIMVDYYYYYYQTYFYRLTFSENTFCYQ